MPDMNDTNEKKNYTFHLEAFNGPLELLMHLIEKNKIDIYDIPIAEIKAIRRFELRTGRYATRSMLQP